MKRTFTSLTALLLAPLAALAAPEQPNVLVISTDQQHAGMLGCAGNRWLKTSAMDSIAKNGARFAVCWPWFFSRPGRQMLVHSRLPNQHAPEAVSPAVGWPS